MTKFTNSRFEYKTVEFPHNQKTHMQDVEEKYLPEGGGLTPDGRGWHAVFTDINAEGTFIVYRRLREGQEWP